MSLTNSTARSWRTIDWLRNTPRIAVPVYQREYRWTPSSCAKLLHDVRSIARNDAEGTHFLGSVLAKSDEAGSVTLVDGQQRITTIQLLLAAVSCASRDEVDGPSADIRRLLADPVEPGTTRLRPHERFEAELRQLLLGSDEKVEPTALSDNFTFLLRELEGSDWREVWAGLQRLEHVTISLERTSNAQQIFESLNATGARLSDDELIHNYVHMGRTYDQQLELEHTTWIPIEDRTAGHMRDFWRDYLILTADLVPDLKGEFGVYEAFKARYPNPLNELTAELQQEWLHCAGLYRVLLNPEHERNEEVQKQLRLLQVFGGTPRPFLLAVYRDLRSGLIDAVSAIDTFEAVQSLFIRRALVGLERDVPMISRLCAEVRADGYPVDGLIRRTPEDPAVRLALTHGSVPQAAYVLRRLQFDDRTDLDLQVEHIHPQQPAPEWSGNGERRWGQLSNEEQAGYRSVLNTIGNLTLLESHLNQGAGNRSLPSKARYYADSEITETKLFPTADIWDDAAIRRRTAALTTKFLERWRRPSDTPMTMADELLKVVDLSRPALRGYPDVFEFAEFEGELWGDVHTSKQLLVRLVDELCRLDVHALEATDYGRRYLKDAKGPRRYRLSNGRWIYAGWAHQYLLEAVQTLLGEFGLDGALRVKLATEPESEVGYR